MIKGFADMMIKCANDRQMMAAASGGPRRGTYADMMGTAGMPDSFISFCSDAAGGNSRQLVAWWLGMSPEERVAEISGSVARNPGGTHDVAAIVRLWDQRAAQAQAIFARADAALDAWKARYRAERTQEIADGAALYAWEK